jgi:hypothetical protein
MSIVERRSCSGQLPITQEQLWLLADQKLNIKERTTRKLCSILLDEKKIFIHKVPRRGSKSAVGYAKTAPASTS